MKRFNYDIKDCSSQDSDYTKISNHDLSWYLHCGCNTAEILEWEYSEAYGIPVEEVQLQIDDFVTQRTEEM